MDIMEIESIPRFWSFLLLAIFVIAVKKIFLFVTTIMAIISNEIIQTDRIEE